MLVTFRHMSLVGDFSPNVLSRWRFTKCHA